MLFTYNPQFRQDRKPTARRDAQTQHLTDCLKPHGIDPDRIAYVGNEKKETRKFVRESPELLRLFFDNYGIRKNCTILSDNGNSFFEDGESVLKKIGFQDHRCYPAAVHQYLSPNDNHLHGTAKQKWRNQKIDYTDDVDSCMYLLQQLDVDTVAHSAHWFAKNMLELSHDTIDTLIRFGNPQHSMTHQTWLRSYRIWMGVDARGKLPDVPKGLEDSLDGSYWEI